MGECLECHVEGRARVIHRTTDQSLHSDVPTARIDQAHVEAFVGKVAARSRNLVGDNAKELAAECEQYLTALAVGIFQSRSSADDFTITAIFEFAGELGRQFFAAIHQASNVSLQSWCAIAPDSYSLRRELGTPVKIS